MGAQLSSCSFRFSLSDPLPAPGLPSPAARAPHAPTPSNLDALGSPLCADEIDAIGTKRYDAHSGGEREIQRTMLELLNQLDGFDAMSEVKVRRGEGMSWERKGCDAAESPAPSSHLPAVTACLCPCSIFLDLASPPSRCSCGLLSCR
jgi:hypothetical protein